MLSFEDGLGSHEGPMNRDEEIDAILQKVCVVSAEFKEGDLQTLLSDLEFTMINISRLLTLVGMREHQRSLVERLSPDLRRLGQNDVRITGVSWGLTHQYVEKAHGAIAGPVAALDALCRELQTVAAMTGGWVEGHFDAFDRIEALVASVTQHAKASGCSIHKDPVFGYEAARQKLENGIREATVNYRRALDEAITRRNEAAERNIEESKHRAEVAAAAGAAALAAGATALASFAGLAIQAMTSPAPEAKKEDKKKERSRISDFYA